MFRSPVVAILGHVDHGKTTLLDYIRKSHLASREHGGITQRIGGYEITTSFKDYHTNNITFIDTPGHEAFAQMRARGTQVADIAILVIDAKDSILPQTVESLSHIKNAGIPFVVAINKIDLPDANPEKVKIDLLKNDVMIEDKGGKVIAVSLSAKTGKGVNELIESLLLLSSDMNLQYEPGNPLKAPIIETKKDKRGVVVSIIVKDGQLKVGDTVYADGQVIKIRALIDDKGQTVNSLLPSTPAEVLGFSTIPAVGTVITNVAPGEVAAPEVKEVKERGAYVYNPEPVEKKLSLIIKADTQGSLDAIMGSLGNNANIVIVFSAVGDIHRSDIFLGKASKSIIIGFGTKPDVEAKTLASQEKVIIKTYSIIYELIEELEEVSSLVKEKEEKERNLKGEAKIQAQFTIEGEKIIGVKVTKGKINLGDMLEQYRDSKLINKGKLVSLKIRAKPVKEVKKDQEAGMVISPPLDITIGDMIKSIL